MLGGSRLISQTTEGDSAYFLTDALGSTRALSDGSAALTDTFTYDAYGGLYSTDPFADFSTTATPYLFTGHRYDSALGLYHARARVYDPAVGRFLSRDTWPVNYSDPIELNRYGYVAGNPVNATDPTGLFIELNSLMDNSVSTRAVVGAFGGGVAGYYSAMIQTVLMVTGVCGPEEQLAFILAGDAGVTRLVEQNVAQGAIYGGIYGGTMAGISSIRNPVIHAAVQNGISTGFTGASLRDSVRDFFQAPSLCTAAALLMDAIDVFGAVGTAHSFSASARGSQSVDFDITTGQPRRTMDETVEGWIRQDDACYNSFSADTPVATPDGDVPISEIEVGDSVLAYHEETRSIGAYPVTATISHVDFTVIDLTIAGETLETTAEHPFYTPGGAWVDAGDLAVGDQVWSREIGFAEVEAVEQRPAFQPMFNLTVDEAHTFFVGDGQWLVHNCLPRVERDLSERRITVIGRMEDLRRFHDNDIYDTWWKSGRVPERDGGSSLVSWTENRRWLDERIDAYDYFILATDPTTLSPNYVPGVPNGNFTYREIQYLRSRGIEVEYRPSG